MPRPSAASLARTVRVFTLLALGSHVCAPVPASAGDLPRAIFELPTLGGDSAIACDINQHGTVLGRSQDGEIPGSIRNNPRAAWKMFLMPRGGPMKQLSEWAGFDPMFVNDRDIVVGELFSSRGRVYGAFMWTAEGGDVTLPKPPGEGFGHPVGLDNAGNVLMNNDSSVYLLLTAEERFILLPCLAGHTCRATAMNEAGSIVGVATEVSSGDEAERHRVPVVWDVEKRAVLPLAVGEGVREPVAINTRGTIVGRAVRKDADHAIAWQGPEHRLIELGPGTPVGLNDHDVVAGTIPGAADGPTTVPALWDLTRQELIRLPPLSPQDSRVTVAGINDAGDVVGTAYDREGAGHPVLYRGYAPVAAH